VPPESVGPAPAAPVSGADRPMPEETVLCGHCGRTASNGLVCIGQCVADSGY